MKLPEPAMSTYLGHGDMLKSDYYTKDQMLQAIRDALEEAEMVCRDAIGAEYATGKVDHNGDKQAARRMASLRAAAEIGRGMSK